MSVTLRGHPLPWILKQGGLESSGRILISSNGTLKKIALIIFFGIFLFVLDFEEKKRKLYMYIFFKDIHFFAILNLFCFYRIFFDFFL